MKERYKGKAAVFAAFLLIFGFGAGSAVAQIDVSPIRLELSQNHDKDVVRITNNEDHVKSYQVEVVAWSQTDDRREVYEPTDQLIAVPPIFTLERGENQAVRVGLMAPPDETTERAYRVFVTELASPRPEAQDGMAIKMRLRIGIPVFVAPTSGLPTATLDFVESMQVDNQVFMRFRNNGNVHVKVTEVQLSAPGLADKVVSPALLYVLPGQTGYLPVALPDGESAGKVTLVTDTLGTQEYELPFSP